MKKILLALAGTASVLALLFGYHTSTSAQLPTATPPAVAGGGNGGGNGGSSTGASRTVTGSVAQTRWGPVQVELTLEGDRITDVSVLQYPQGNGHDQQINSYALPILVQETLEAQSADIDMVSGATVTSQGYRESLQSALDQVSS